MDQPTPNGLEDRRGPQDRSHQEPALHTILSGLGTEAVDPDLGDLDLRGTSDLVHAMIDADRVLPDAVAGCAAQIAAAVDGITARLRDGGRLIYLGAGTAGRLGVLDASEIPPTFGTDPGVVQALIAGGAGAVAAAVEDAEDDAAAALADLDRVGVTAADAVVGISASGRTPYVVAGVQRARDRGALTIGVSNNSPSDVGRVADIAIEVVVGPEFISGSTRLRSGTAQKMVLNLLSTISMVRLNKTYGNLMVDLRATNDKLRARSERTVAEATGVPIEQAAATLEQAEGSVKTAILMVESGLTRPHAEACLAEHDGNLRRAIAATADGA